MNHVASACRSRTGGKVRAVSTNVKEEVLMTIDVRPESVAMISGGWSKKIYAKLIIQENK